MSSPGRAITAMNQFQISKVSLLLITHSSPPGQPPGKFPGLHSGFLMQNTQVLISKSKLHSRGTLSVRNVTVSYGSCDGVRGILGRLVILPGNYEFYGQVDKLTS